MDKTEKRQVASGLVRSRLLQDPSARTKRVDASSNYLQLVDEPATESKSKPPSTTEQSQADPQSGKGTANQGEQSLPEPNHAAQSHSSSRSNLNIRPHPTSEMVRPNISMSGELKNTLDSWAQTMRQQKIVARRRGRNISNEMITSSTIIRAAMQVIVQRMDAEDFGLIQDEAELRAIFMDMLTRNQGDR